MNTGGPCRWAWLSYPLAFLYDGLTRLRNFLYDKEILSSSVPPFPSICVGNLSAGGTGKTPLVEYLLRQLSSTSHIALLSRGYGRKIKRPLIAQPKLHTPIYIGDEVYQIYKKFPHIGVVVSSNRQIGCQLISEHFPDTDMILMDDGFQHRKLKAHMYLLLSSYTLPFHKDHIFPRGWLRENKKNAKRAQALIVSKCPKTLTLPEQENISQESASYLSPNTPIFFSYIHYLKPHPFGTEKNGKHSCVILITGIAQSKPLKEYLKSKYKKVCHICLPDHHLYTHKDIKSILECYKSILKCCKEKHKYKPMLLSTEKDYVKLLQLLRPEDKNYPWYYLPIQTRWLPGQEKEFKGFLKKSFPKMRLDPHISPTTDSS
ncbi:MAG: tetraacyldisaccharide 4'-kinase [Cytophagales bacterium]|nr:tetraacyldisaccharide 4'-kinase [Cytophagales bacterium]